MKSGVYAFFNKNNKKVYVGSSKDIITRKEKHLKDLRKKRHHNAALQYDWNNGDNFDFKILEICEKKPAHLLRTYECDFINKFLDEGYYLYNSNLSCQGKYPYFMVRPNFLETVENSDNVQIKRLEDEIKQLKADIKVKDETNHKLMLEKYQLVKDHRKEINKVNKRYDFDPNDSFINEHDNNRLNINFHYLKLYQNRTLVSLDEVYEIIFNNYFNLECEIERHYLDQFSKLSLFNRIRCNYCDLESYKFDKNSFDKYGFLNNRIDSVKNWLNGILKESEEIKERIKAIGVNND